MPFDTDTLARIARNDPELQGIHLRGFITDEDIKNLVTAARNGHNTNLKSILIYEAQISDEGAKLLAELENIEKLDLSDNDISSEGACAIAKMKNLRYLNLAGNQVDDKGAIALAGNQTIESLFLFANENITTIGIERFLTNTTLTEFVFDKKRFSKTLVEAIEKRLDTNEEALVLVDRAKRPRPVEGSEEMILEGLRTKDDFRHRVLRVIDARRNEISLGQWCEELSDIQEDLTDRLNTTQAQTPKQRA